MNVSLIKLILTALGALLFSGILYLTGNPAKRVLEQFDSAEGDILSSFPMIKKTTEWKEIEGEREMFYYFNAKDSIQPDYEIYQMFQKKQVSYDTLDVAADLGTAINSGSYITFRDRNEWDSVVTLGDDTRIEGRVERSLRPVFVFSLTEKEKLFSINIRKDSYVEILEAYEQLVNTFNNREVTVYYHDFDDDYSPYRVYEGRKVIFEDEVIREISSVDFSYKDGDFTMEQDSNYTFWYEQNVFIFGMLFFGFLVVRYGIGTIKSISRKPHQVLRYTVEGSLIQIVDLPGLPVADLELYYMISEEDYEESDAENLLKPQIFDKVHSVVITVNDKQVSLYGQDYRLTESLNDLVPLLTAEQIKPIFYSSFIEGEKQSSYTIKEEEELIWIYH